MIDVGFMPQGKMFLNFLSQLWIYGPGVGFEPQDKILCSFQRDVSALESRDNKTGRAITTHITL